MTREPNQDAHRLTSVTAQNPGTQRAHDSHDRLLVARFALGDELASDEAASVRAVLAGCTDCSELVSEMQVVQHATAEALAPARPRDFFITPEQAASLRPNAWMRLLGRFSAPRMNALRPLAGATLAIGIVLVGVGAVLPNELPAAAPEMNKEMNTTMVAGSPAAGEGAGDNVAGQQADLQLTPDPNSRELDPNAKASPSAFGTTMEMLPVASGALRIASDASPAADATAATAMIIDASPGAEDVPGSESALATAPGRTDDVPGSAVLILGLLLAAVSALVLMLAWLARRDSDPLLR